MDSPISHDGIDRYAAQNLDQSTNMISMGVSGYEQVDTADAQRAQVAQDTRIAISTINERNLAIRCQDEYGISLADVDEMRLERSTLGR
jgi:hypothetical protein